MISAHMRPRRRPSYAERQILAILREHPTRQLSFDAMAAMADLDRRTLITAMAKLRQRGAVALVKPGRGCRPNSYALL